MAKAKRKAAEPEVMGKELTVNRRRQGKYPRLKDDDEEMLLPWERMPGETSLSYEKFLFFKDLKGNRCPDEVGKHFAMGVGGVRTLMAKRFWVQRALAWDRHLASTAHAHAEEYVKQEVVKHIGIARTMQDIAQSTLAHMAMAIKDNPSVAAKLGVSASEARKMAEAGIKLERLCLGEATSITKHSYDLSAATDEQLDLLAAGRDPAALNLPIVKDVGALPPPKSGEDTDTEVH